MSNCITRWTMRLIIRRRVEVGRHPRESRQYAGFQKMPSCTHSWALAVVVGQHPAPNDY